MPDQPKGQPRELPILMHARSVRAVLDGSKTQTRRIIKPQPLPTFTDIQFGEGCVSFWDGLRCQRYQSPWWTGDTLWVRETWLHLDQDHYQQPDRPKDAWCEYGRRGKNGVAYRADTDSDGERIRAEYGYKWRPSIFMPRWASRLTLRVKGVRVERVQDASPADILAEGVGDPYKAPEQQRPAWRRLWDDTNGPGAWERNDWVWVIEFERCDT